jgi:hypothetical protein
MLDQSCDVASQKQRREAEIYHKSPPLVKNKNIRSGVNFRLQLYGAFMGDNAEEIVQTFH